MKGPLTEKEKQLIIELKEAGQTLTAISKRIERNRITVRKYLNSMGYAPGNIFYTDDEKEKIKRLYESGVSICEIAKRLNKGPSGVNHYLKIQGYGTSLHKNLFSEAEKAKVIKVFEETRNCALAAKAIGRSRDGVWSMLKKEGYNTHGDYSAKLSSEQITEIRSLYTDGFTAKEILPLVREDGITTENTIIKIVKEGGVPIRPRGFRNIIDHEDFFDNIDTQEKAYMVGFLLADGYVMDLFAGHKRNPLWAIQLHRKDEYILESFRQLVGVHHGLYHTATRPTVLLVVSSAHMTQELAKYNVVPRKSFITSFPSDTIPRELYRHVIRGIFDGDGCISGAACTFFGKSQLVFDVRQILHEEIDVNYNGVFTKDDGVHQFSFSSKKDVTAFYHYLYDGATLFLTRKKDRFEQLPFILNQLTDVNAVVTA